MSQNGASRLDRIEAILENVANRIHDHEQYFGRVFEGFDRVAGKFGQIDETVDRVVTLVEQKTAEDTQDKNKRYDGVVPKLDELVDSLIRTDKNIERIVTIVENLIDDAKDQRRLYEEQRKRIDELEAALKKSSESQERLDESLGSMIQIVDELIRRRTEGPSQ